MEFTAICLNATQGLIKGQRLLTLLRQSPGTTDVLTLFAQYLTTVPWAMYDVRRTFSPRVDGRFNHARAVKVFAASTREAMLTQLHTRAEAGGVKVTVGDSRFPDDRHSRVWWRYREPVDPARPVVDAEHLLTVAPATAITARLAL